MNNQASFSNLFIFIVLPLPAFPDLHSLSPREGPILGDAERLRGLLASLGKSSKLAFIRIFLGLQGLLRCIWGKSPSWLQKGSSGGIFLPPFMGFLVRKGDLALEDVSLALLTASRCPSPSQGATTSDRFIGFLLHLGFCMSAIHSDTKLPRQRPQILAVNTRKAPSSQELVTISTCPCFPSWEGIATRRQRVGPCGPASYL